MKWTEQVLHNFGNGTDGVSPNGAVIFDAGGNLYGTANECGVQNNGAGFGVIWEITP